MIQAMSQEPRKVNSDWWQRASTIASILSSIVIAGIGILVTWSIQSSQLAITKAQFDATKMRNEDDRRAQESKLASDLFPQLLSDNPKHRALALTLLRQTWRSQTVDGILAVLATSDDSSEVRKVAIKQLGSSTSALAVSTLGGIATDESRPKDERALALSNHPALGHVAQVTVQINGASRAATLVWDQNPLSLADRGTGNYEAVFPSTPGKHLYSILVFGSPGDHWTATLTAGKSTQNHEGHLSPAGTATTGDTLFNVN